MKSEVEVGEAGLGELTKKRKCPHKMTPEMHEHQIMKIGLIIDPKGGIVLYSLSTFLRENVTKAMQELAF